LKRCFKTKHKYLRILLSGAVLAALSVLTPDEYTGRLLALMAINAMLGTAINLLSGYLGQVSLAHAAFFGVGAYTTAVMTKTLGTGFWTALLCGLLLAFLFGVLLGIPTLKLKGHYLTIATLAFNMMCYILFHNWDAVTNGAVGMMGLPYPKLFGIALTKSNMMLPIIVIFETFMILFIAALLDSAYGRAFAAIKLDEISSGVSGVNVLYYKVLGFGLSAGFAGIAGAFYAGYTSYITPELFTVSASIKILTICVVGGIGTLPGPIVGALWIAFLSEVLRNFVDLEQVIYGVMLVFVIVVMPKGIYPTVRQAIARIVPNTAQNNRLNDDGESGRALGDSTDGKG
jgi:branched-chain amino acid transport system permease protein